MPASASPFRSFLLVALVCLCVFATLASATHANPVELHAHLSSPARTPLTPERALRALVRARQVVPASPASLAASAAARDARDTVRQLVKLEEELRVHGDELGRGAERVRRALLSARAADVAAEEGQAIHDNLYLILRALSSTSIRRARRTASTPGGSAESNSEAIVPLRPAAADDAPRLPAASPSPVPQPSGASVTKRSLPLREAAAPSSALLSTLTLLHARTSPLRALLPALPAAQRDALVALLDEVGTEVESLAAAVVGDTAELGQEVLGGPTRTIGVAQREREVEEVRELVRLLSTVA
ncbi:hypothetical protein Rhopal_004419-T1 [Rhodotorula paludigena]|uniref:Proteophosphoglycan 5 n=1 Tax=Rhodotorula paludigena TaxID=86838 RepID=A0AAV5GMG4_9BASI|nr:hypothetical protein Rhopal_004419-T1 [Rhodotorula paludigena]